MGAGRSRLAGRPVGLARRAWAARPGAEPASSDAFLRARTLRSCLRALALANTTGLPPRAGVLQRRALAELGALRFGLAIGDDGTPTLAPAGEGVDRALATLAAIAVASAQAGTWSRFKACRKDTCGWIFYDQLAQPLVQLVLDDDLRQPVEDGRLPAPEGHGMRAALYVVGLAFGRVRRRSSGALLAAVGIAIGTAVLIGVLAGTKIAQDRSVSQAVERIPAASRSVRAVWFGVPVGADAGVSRARRDRALEARRASACPARRRSSSSARAPSPGHFVSLAGVDGPRAVRPPDERTPAACVHARRAARCCGCAARARCRTRPGCGSCRSGRATLRSSQLFGDFLAPTDNALEDRELAPALQQGASYHRPPPAPLVVAEGIEALTRAPATANTYRSYAWVWPLAAGRPRLWEIDGLVARSERARAALVRRLDRLQRAGARRGASGDGDVGHRRRAAAAARRRRGGGPALRLRRARGAEHEARSRGGQAAGSPGTGRGAGSCGS